jgi:predicted  nucleic acid-binding Zn-ribbon protein
MKAEVVQQRSLLELAEVDTELSRVAHRAAHLPEQQRWEQIQSDHRAAEDRLGALRIALEDLDSQVAHFEDEIDAVRRREDRDRSLLDSVTNPKQLSDLQHELETLRHRQASLEDSLLEIMERREELQSQAADELKAIDGLETDLASAERALNESLAEIDQTRNQRASRRDELTTTLAPELIALYEKQRTARGVGAGLLQGRRCGACRIEIDKGELARISTAAEDDVLRCPECGAILLRVKGSGR